MRTKEADSLANWAKVESLMLVTEGRSEPGSPREKEAIRGWKAQRPDLFAAMSERQALRNLAHVLVQRTVDQERAYLRAGMPLDEARVQAFADWMMMEEGEKTPRGPREPITA